MSLPGHAQISDVSLGYCAGELPQTGTIRYSEPESWVSGAIYIPASTLNTYGGNRIDGIRAGLASKLNIEELTVWVREDLDGDNLVQQTITTSSDPGIAKGWNEVRFDNPWAIPSDNVKGIYVGYSFFQKKTSLALATLSTPSQNALFVQFADLPWEDRSDEGTLCVEALVSGDNLPKVNLALLSLSVPDIYIIDRGSLQIGGLVQNLATYTITGFDVSAYVEGVEVGTAQVKTELPYGKTDGFSVELPLGINSVGDGTGSVTVAVGNITEGVDEDPSDNTLSASFRIVEHDFRRRIFVEEFTTEKCPNCPRVGNYIHDALEKDEFKDDVIVVCHHSGYYTDFLTTSFDASYLWLFNEGGQTYAPAICVDRNPDGNFTSVWCPTSSSEMEASWRQALAEPAFVSLNISAEADPGDENHVTVTVNGARSFENLCDNPTITVYVVEDNINANSQAGASSWVHQHVNRAVNSTWGDPVEFEGNEYEYTCEFNLSAFWKREDLRIVAMIANYNSENATDCIVQNASCFDLSDILAGIASVEADDSPESEIYSLSGLKMNNTDLTPGLYIRKTGNKTEKFFVK